MVRQSTGIGEIDPEGSDQLRIGSEPGNQQEKPLLCHAIHFPELVQRGESSQLCTVADDPAGKYRTYSREGGQQGRVGQVQLHRCTGWALKRQLFRHRAPHHDPALQFLIEGTIDPINFSQIFLFPEFSSMGTEPQEVTPLIITEAQFFKLLFSNC